MNSELNLPEWDVIIIGGGAAGLSSALMLGRARRRVLVIDEGEPRNRFASHMHGVLGMEGVPPTELVSRGRQEASEYGVCFSAGRVQKVENMAGGLNAVLESGETFGARTLIAATGLSDELPEIPGLEQRWGTGVLHCPYCHGFEVADRRIGVLATSPAAMHQAQMVRQWSDRVTLFSAGMGPIDSAAEARLRSRSIAIVDSVVTEVLGGDENVSAVRTEDGREIEIDALFTMGAPIVHDGFLTDLGLERTELPFGMGSVLATDPTGRTSHERVWAVGNVINPMANVPMAIGAGAGTGGAVNGALVDEDFELAAADADSAENSAVRTGGGHDE